jgi:hypothetical protein
MLAVEREEKGVVKFLLSRGADITIRSPSGKSVLEIAPNKEMREILQNQALLLDKVRGVGLPVPPTEILGLYSKLEPHWPSQPLHSTPPPGTPAAVASTHTDAPAGGADSNAATGTDTDSDDDYEYDTDEDHHLSEPDDHGYWTDYDNPAYDDPRSDNDHDDDPYDSDDFSSDSDDEAAEGSEEGESDAGAEFPPGSESDEQASVNKTKEGLMRIIEEKTEELRRTIAQRLQDVEELIPRAQRLVDHHTANRDAGIVYPPEL